MKRRGGDWPCSSFDTRIGESVMSRAYVNWLCSISCDRSRLSSGRVAPREKRRHDGAARKRRNSCLLKKNSKQLLTRLEISSDLRMRQINLGPGDGDERSNIFGNS